MRQAGDRAGARNRFPPSDPCSTTCERLASTGAAYTASSVISKLFAVALLPVYTRHLTRADYGAAEVLLAAVVALSIVFRLGIIEALLRFYYERGPVHVAGRGRAQLGRVPASSRSPSASLLVAAFAGPLSEALLDRRDTELMLIAAGGLWVFTIYELLMALFRLDERARAYFTASLANVLLTIALTVWLVVVRGRGRARAAARQLRRLRRRSWPRCSWIAPRAAGRSCRPARRLRPMLRFGLPTMPAELSLYALNFIDRVVLARLAGLAEAGLYCAGGQVQPGRDRGRARRSTSPGRRWPIRSATTTRPGARTRVVVTYYLLLAFTVVLALSLEARWVVRALAAPEFFDSYKAVPLVSTGVALYALYLVLSVAVGRTGRTEFNFPVTGVGRWRSTSALNLVLVPPYGLVGAGIALVGAYLVMLALMYARHAPLFPGRRSSGDGWRASSGSRLRCTRPASCCCPTSGVARVRSRGRRWRRRICRCCTASGFFHPAELSGARDARARSSARAVRQRRRRRTWKPCAAART